MLLATRFAILSSHAWEVSLAPAHNLHTRQTGVGETRLSFTRANREFSFEGLVVENLDVDVLAGTPFMGTNDISIRPAKRQVMTGDGFTYAYGSQAPAVTSTAARRAIVLRAPPSSTTIWPGDFIEINLPDEALPDCEYALEPRSNAPSVRKLTSSQVWPPPSIVSSLAGKIRFPNLSSEPHSLKHNEHFCQVNPVFSPEFPHPFPWFVLS